MRYPPAKAPLTILSVVTILGMVFAIAAVLTAFVLIAAAHGATLATPGHSKAQTKSQSSVSPNSKSAGSALPSKIRRVEFTYHAEITGIDHSASHLEAWIPLPRENQYQRVSGLSIDSTAHTQVLDHAASGNRILHLVADAPFPASIPVAIRFKVRRVEEAPNLQQARQNLREPSDGPFAGFLGPNRLIPISGQISRVSAAVGDTNGSSYQQAYAIYEYVIAHMTYDKTACDVKKGNCTDFHSLFIALARSRGIPARFTIGFPLGAASSGEITSYHCWAEFYSGGTWVPVDALEAWKHPNLNDYYFGHLGADRVGFSTGRDLVMIPRQKGGPLNYLIYPYVEVDGKPLSPADIQTRIEYRDSGPQR